MCGSCEGTCIFPTFWYSNKCEVDMQIARITTHCEIASYARSSPRSVRDSEMRAKKVTCGKLSNNKINQG